MKRIGVLAAEILSAGRAPDEPAGVFFVPGRIEVLGKHTDYAGGRSLVAATTQGIWFVVSPREDAVMRMIDKGRGQSVAFAVEDQKDRGVQDWSVYPRTVASRVAQSASRDLVGADIAFASNLPPASGLSSSSVLVVGTFMALSRCNDLAGDPGWIRNLPTREHLAAYLGAVENGRSYGSFLGGEGVGTRGGDQDHTAILCSCKGEIRQYRFLPTVLERTLTVPPGYVFAVAVSGVRARKSGAAMGNYNRISKLAGGLEHLWESCEGCAPATLGSIVGEAPEGVDRLAAAIECTALDPGDRQDLKERLSQFYQETEEIIPAFADALAAGDLVSLGRSVDLSMRLATELLGNQIEETIWLAAAARDLDAVAASAFGAGFGGAVWALVPEDSVGDFLTRWSGGYLERFPEHRTEARFFSTAAGGPAIEL